MIFLVRLQSNVSWGCSHLKGLTEASKMHHSHGCAGGLSCTGLLERPHNLAAGFLQSEWSQESKMEATLSFMI